MFYIGLFLALLVGIILGLIGGGGSILTLPLIEHFFGISTYEATTYSLFIVTLSSIFGVAQRLGKDLINYKVGLLFLIPSTLVAFSIRLLSLPDTISLARYAISRDLLISFLLALVMLFVAFRMFVSKEQIQDNKEKAVTFGRILVMGSLTGFLSGFLGAGGGFIIVPILLAMGIPIKKAVATSMFIIVIQSAFAILGDYLNKMSSGGLNVDFKIVGILTILMILGVFVGTKLQQHTSGGILKKMFATVLVLVSLGILIDQFM